MINTSSIKIYPNPCAQYFNLEFDADFKPIELMLINTLGYVVKTVKVNQQNKIEVNIGNLPNGNYIIRLLNDKEYSQAISLIKTQD
ncbi:MAG: T9SS type A sorting domain-containing protein [Bacteroidia bacterium]|nr:T9SS type A sorting domain-containing protein [Bacteroidia bacterium]